MDREEKINELIARKGCNKRELAAALGFNISTFYAKMKGPLQFYREEVEVMAEILGDEIYEVFPEYREREYSICTTLRMLRVVFLKKTLGDFANVLGITKQAWQRFEICQTPPAEYLSKLAAHYHIPCSVLLNVDENTWKICRKESCVLKKLEEDPYFLEYARTREHFGMFEDKKRLLRWISQLINDLDYYGLQELLDVIQKIHQKNYTTMQPRMYRKLTEGLLDASKLAKKPQVLNLMREKAAESNNRS